MNTTHSYRITADNEQWDLEITPQKTLFDLHLKEIWDYRDLLILFVRRDFIAIYKQTILGPLWHVVQPIFSTITFTIIFSRVAGISTSGVPAPLFYFTGLTIWQFFSKCLTTSSNSFIANAAIFGKVYFPRLIMPLSTMISAFITFLIQFGLLILIYLYYIFKGYEFQPTWWLAALPLTILIMAALGLGGGIIISSLTTKYRDLSQLVSFGIRLLMYLTPVIYPISIIPEKYQKFIILNPLAPAVEGFKFILLGQGTFNVQLLFYSLGISIFILFIGILLFNRVENKFVDTL